MENSTQYNFDKLFSEYQNKVYNIALNMVQRVEDAEDVTQDVFVEIHRSLPSFNNQSLISTWIHRIAVNKCLDFIKAKKTKKRFAVITHLFHPETGEQLHEASSFTHPGIALEQKENARCLFQAIDSLNDKQRTAFVLSQIQHLSQKEIAAVMILSEKAVESLVQRAKSNLRKQLENMYDQRRK